MNKYYVYALVDPINKVPFYIGKGCGKRAYIHLSGKDKCNVAKHKYIATLRSLGVEPEVRFIKTALREKNAYALESFCIKAGHKYLPLTNIVGIKHPPSRKGHQWSADSIKRRSDTVIHMHAEGYKRPPIKESIRKHLSNINKGKSISVDTRLKISETLKEKTKIKYSHIINSLYDFYITQNLSVNSIALLFEVKPHIIKNLLSINKIFKYGITAKKL